MKKVILMSLLSLVPRLLTAQEAGLESLAGEQWYGLYMNGKKIGYSVSELALTGDGGATLREDASFKLNMAGVKQDMRIFSRRTYGPGGELVQIESRVDDVSGSSIFNAHVEGELLILESKVGGQSRTSTLPRPRETLQDVLKQKELVSGNPAIGDTISFSLFEPMYQMEIDAHSEIVGVEERVLDGVRTKVFEVKTRLDTMGIESIAYIAENGITLEDRIAGIITTRLEPEAMAKDVHYSNDVIVSNAARVSEPIANPRDRDSLDLRLTGPLGDEHLFNDERQSLTAEGDHFRFNGRKIATDDLEPATLPIDDDGVREWLKPTLFVQSDHPKLIEKARSIVGGETDALKVSERLTEWVFNHVRTTFSARLTNSLEVLENMEGDCTEHSMLYIGLARAAGIPAREVAGLIYVEGQDSGFYFHQWATVWVGKWIDVDPTFNQPIADATHIKLAEGDLFEQTKLLPIIGQIRIEVVTEETES